MKKKMLTFAFCVFVCLIFAQASDRVDATKYKTVKSTTTDETVVVKKPNLSITIPRKPTQKVPMRDNKIRVALQKSNKLLY